MNPEDELYLTLKYELKPFTESNQARDFSFSLPDGLFDDIEDQFWYDPNTLLYRNNRHKDRLYTVSEVKYTLLDYLLKYDRRRSNPDNS